MSLTKERARRVTSTLPVSEAPKGLWLLSAFGARRAKSPGRIPLGGDLSLNGLLVELQPQRKPDDASWLRDLEQAQIPVEVDAASYAVLDRIHDCLQAKDLSRCDTILAQAKVEKLAVQVLLARRRYPPFWQTQAGGPRHDPASAEFVTADGHGLTCATFVLAVFASHGIDLLRLAEWEPRAEDEAWRHRIIHVMRKSGVDEAHVRVIETERHCARYRPEEVAASGAVDKLPLGFRDAARIGERIVQHLFERAKTKPSR